MRIRESHLQNIFVNHQLGIYIHLQCASQHHVTTMFRSQKALRGCRHMRFGRVLHKHLQDEQGDVTRNHHFWVLEYSRRLGRKEQEELKKSKNEKMKKGGRMATLSRILHFITGSLGNAASMRVATTADISSSCLHGTSPRRVYPWQIQTQLPSRPRQLRQAVPGPFHHRRYHRNRLTEAATRCYFQQLVFTLLFCHQNSVAHRNMEPRNLPLD